LSKLSVKKNPWLIFAVTSLGACLVGIDGGIVNVALPTITQQFNASIAGVQWTITGYLLSLCALLPLCGRLGDLYTKRLLYLLGFIFFTISSLLCSTSTNLTQLIIFRIIQGIGGAMIMANNQALILTNFPKNQHGQALGLNSAMVSIGLILGPTIGGFLIAAFSWQSIFIINIPIGIIGIYIGYKVLPRNEKRKKEQLDIIGAVLFAVGLSILLVTLSNGLEWNWTILKIALYSLLGFAVLLVFILRQQRIKSPMLDLMIFKARNFSLGNISVFLAFMSLATNNLLLPFSLQNLFHLSPGVIGLFLFIPPLFMVVIGPISGYLADRIEQTILIAVGLLILTIGMLIEAFIQIGTNLWAIIIAQSLLGLGCGIFMSPNNSNTLSAIPIEKLGIASSVNSLVRNLGKIFGTALTAMLFVEVQRRYSINTTDANTPFIISFRFSFIAASILTLIATSFTIGRLPMFNKRKNDPTKTTIKKK
jgi:EmrB/QacA subfamily drug resistance transporter